MYGVLKKKRRNEIWKVGYEGRNTIKSEITDTMVWKCVPHGEQHEFIKKMTTLMILGIEWTQKKGSAYMTETRILS